MKIYVCKDDHTYIWGQHIPLNAWYGQDTKSWWFCTVHGEPEEENTLHLRRFNGERWIKVYEKSTTTKNICQWATTMRLWWTKCHWFKEEDEEKSLAAKLDSHTKRYESLMKHERKHKSGGSGIRLSKENYYANILFTDYECTNRPMHDFQSCH